MNDSILISVKKVLGLDEYFEAFDQDILMHVNTVFSILNQMGVGKPGFMVVDANSRWTEFFGDYDPSEMNMVRTYVCQKTRMMFDPPTGNLVKEAIEQTIEELEYRLYALCTYGEEKDDDSTGQ